MRKNEFAKLIKEWRTLTEAPEDEKKEENAENADDAASEESEESEDPKEGEASEMKDEDGNTVPAEEVEEAQEEAEEAVVDAFEGAEEALEAAQSALKSVDDIIQENPELKKRVDDAVKGLRKGMQASKKLFGDIGKFAAEKKKFEYVEVMEHNAQMLDKAMDIGQGTLDQVEQGDSAPEEKAQEMVAIVEEFYEIIQNVFEKVKGDPLIKLDANVIAENLIVMRTTQKILNENF